MANTLNANEIDNYDFGDAVAPDGFDPDAQGYATPTPGVHMFYVADFRITQFKTFNGKDFGQWTGHQLEPRLVIPRGQLEEGASLFDYIPMPTPGTSMPRSLANRWANFLRGLGFRCPPDRLVPAGFKLQDILNGPCCMAECYEDTYEGKTRIKVRLFGYSPVDAAQPNRAGNGNGNGPNKANRAAATSPMPAAPAANAAAPVVGNLDDL